VIAARVLEGRGTGRGVADLMEAGPGRAAAGRPGGAVVTATAPDAVILARRLDPGEECAGY
jgi:hypothetical protein